MQVWSAVFLTHPLAVSICFQSSRQEAIHGAVDTVICHICIYDVYISVLRQKTLGGRQGVSILLVTNSESFIQPLL